MSRFGNACLFCVPDVVHRAENMCHAPSRDLTALGWVGEYRGTRRFMCDLHMCCLTAGRGGHLMSYDAEPDCKLPCIQITLTPTLTICQRAIILTKAMLANVCVKD